MTRPSCLGRHAAAAPPNPAQLRRPRPAGRSNPNPNGLAGHRHPLRAHPAAAATPPRRPGGHPPCQGIPPEARAPPQRRPGSWRPWPCQGKKYPACGRPPRRRRGGVAPKGAPGASARSAGLPAERLPGPRHSESGAGLIEAPRRGPPGLPILPSTLRSPGRGQGLQRAPGRTVRLPTPPDCPTVPQVPTLR